MINKKINDLEEFYCKKFLNFNPEIYDDDLIIKQNKALNNSETINLLNRRQKGKFYSPLLSFWPLFLTASLGLFLILLAAFMHSSKLFKYLNFLTIVALIAVGVAVSFWFSIFYIEKKKGNHTVEIRRNIQLGFYLFLFTEALCFIALFWVFLHSFLAASIHTGIYNPGEGIANLYINEFVTINKNWDIYGYKSVGTPGYFKISSMYTLMDTELYKTKNIKIHVNFYDRGQLINPYRLPLLNTFILLTSAASLNISHLYIKTSKYIKSFFWLFATILLGLFFVFIQYREYRDCSFQYNDGIYAACFFSLTGLHGIHVMIGISALITCAINLLFKNYSPNFHQSYAYSILYWHFVDVIWLFVYFILYLWPAYYFFNDEIFATYKNFFTVHFSKNYFDTVIVSNAFTDFKINNQFLLIYFSKNFNLETINFDIMESQTPYENFNSKNFYYPAWKKIKNILNNKEVNNYLLLINDINCITEFYANKIKCHAFTPAVTSVVRALRYENIFHIFYPVTPQLDNIQIYVLEKPKLFLTLTECMELFYYLNSWKSIYSKDALKGHDFISTIENFFLKAHDMRVYRNSMLTNYDPHYELLQYELIEGKNFINYNEIKKDPILFCFVLTEMHKELISIVEDAYIVDCHNKYKRFMIYIFFRETGLKYFEWLWCYFFFPYINSKDASVRYRI